MNAPRVEPDHYETVGSRRIAMYKVQGSDGAWRLEPQRLRGGKKGAKGKGKRGRDARMPPGLRDCVPTDDNGNRLCFAYNLGHCDYSHNNCPKGAHKCCRPGCFGRHPASECPM